MYVHTNSRLILYSVTLTSNPAPCVKEEGGADAGADERVSDLVSRDLGWDWREKMKL
jgi:hypothetical protein